MFFRFFYKKGQTKLQKGDILIGGVAPLDPLVHFLVTDIHVKNSSMWTVEVERLVDPSMRLRWRAKRAATKGHDDVSTCIVVRRVAAQKGEMPRGSKPFSWPDDHPVFGKQNKTDSDT